MKRLTLALAAALVCLPATAAEIGGTGTQPYACTVVGDPTVSLTSNGQNLIAGSGSGSIFQNNDTTYTLSSVTVTGPDSNRAGTISAGGSVLGVASTNSSSDTQDISGELSENVVYTVSVTSTDGILTSGSYTATASLTCTAAP